MACFGVLLEGKTGLGDALAEAEVWQRWGDNVEGRFIVASFE